MHTVFINYRRGDTAGEARALFTELAAILGKDSVFMDVDAIALGRDFREVVRERLESCDLMLALVGRNWVDAKNPAGQRRLEDPDDLVRLEIDAALKRNIPVTPVIVQGAQMPTVAELPKEIESFAYRNGFELSHNRWESDVQEMVKRLGLSKQRDSREIRDIETQRKTPREAGTEPGGQQPTRKPWRAIVGVSVVAIALLGGGVFYYRTVVEEKAKEAAAQLERERVERERAAAQAERERGAIQAEKERAAAQAERERAGATQRTTARALPAPVPRGPACGSTIPRPREDQFFILSWAGIEGASNYSVEVDCLGCSGRDWYSSRGSPWHVQTALGLRSPIYSSKIHVPLRKQGGLALRWRVWAVDHDGKEGQKSNWCQVACSG